MIRIVVAAAVVLATSPVPAHATFHLMQVEQVIAGVDGDDTVQAVQLRMRADGQEFVGSSRLRVVDATGANPVLLSGIASNVDEGAVGSRVLLATASFAAHTTPAAVPDFVLDNPIPPSYLAAGCIQFESDGGTQMLWRLAWGGASYTGPTTGLTFNDADGNFGPAYAGPLPAGSNVALQFQGTATALSLNNDADYMLTSGAAVFVNNAGDAFTVVSTTAAPAVAHPVTIGEPLVAPNPFSTSTRIELQLARAAKAHLVIVDAQGRRLGSIARSLPAGTSSLPWDGRDAGGRALPAGVYFYRLELDGAIKSGRMLLLR
jgi:hypothetical protein